MGEGCRQRERLALEGSARWSHVFPGEKVSSWSLGALNLLADAQGVRFGTFHYLVRLQHWVPKPPLAPAPARKPAPKVQPKSKPQLSES